MIQAAQARLSERSFYRKFTEATGKTPAHFVEGLRLDAARTRIASGTSFDDIAKERGLTAADTDQMKTILAELSENLAQVSGVLGLE